MHHTWNRIKTLVIFLLVVALLVSYFHNDSAREAITGLVSALGG